MTMLENQLRLAISDEFFDAYSRLPKKAQGKMSEVINRFKQAPARSGLNYETIHNSRDKRMRSIRIDEAHRAIILKPDTGNTYILLWADKHDEAYQWATRKRCIVNEVSGALQIVDVEAVEAATDRLQEKYVTQTTGRFDNLKDRDLMRLGVPSILLPALHQVVTDADVDQILPHLPTEASDALIMLAAGYPIGEVFAQLEKTKEQPPIDPEDLEAALDRVDSRSRFIVITDDAELEEMLAAPLDKWRVFLHPSQRNLVERDASGSVRVLGGAGTGKTVVAIHRAKWLAQHRFNRPNDRILLTTFTKNLAVDIEANLRSICSKEIMQRIRVINIHAWVEEFLKQEGVETTVIYDETATAEIWEEAYQIAPPELEYALSFYQEEWRDVVVAQGCQVAKDYLVAKRNGRGTRLSRQQRQAIWVVFEEYRNLLKERGKREPEDAMHDARQILATKGAEALPYQAIIVDEAQDLSDAAFSLLRSIVGESKPNDLFIVGDAHQRIYGKVATLSRCGIDIRGRSKKLRLNYRTTDEIRAWAISILTGVAADDLDGGLDSTKDYRSLMHGEVPVIRGFNRFEDEINYLQELLGKLEAKQGLSSICLAVRTNKLVDTYEQALKNLNIRTKRIHRHQADNPAEAGLRLATMHRIKGLQFDYTILPGLDERTMPLKNLIDRASEPSAKEKLLASERCLLHVAATRAKKQVFVSYFGNPSNFLDLNSYP
jgi:superfamily I DNA/RNA helicase